MVAPVYHAFCGLDDVGTVMHASRVPRNVFACSPLSGLRICERWPLTGHGNTDLNLNERPAPSTLQLCALPSSRFSVRAATHCGKSCAAGGVKLTAFQEVRPELGHPKLAKGAANVLVYPDGACDSPSYAAASATCGCSRVLRPEYLKALKSYSSKALRPHWNGILCSRHVEAMLSTRSHRCRDPLRHHSV